MPLQLLKSNAAIFENSIPIADLPCTFAEAVKVTQKVRARYLWIDSLCIIQDSPDDRNYEALHMCDVYRNCMLCIAAGAASNSTEGLLTARDPAACVTSYIVETS